MGLKIVHNSETDTIFKSWQAKGLESIEKTERIPIGSKQVWLDINEAGIKISRASVINFLKNLHEQDLLFGHNTTGKGGMRFDYTFHIDRAYFNSQVVSQLMGNLITEFPAVDHSKVLQTVIMNVQPA